MVTKRKNRQLWSAGILLVCEPLYAHTLKVAGGGFLGGFVPHLHAMDYLLLILVAAVAWGWKFITRKKGR